MNKLSIYDWALFPNCKAYISTGKIIPSYGYEFKMAAPGCDPKPILIPLWEMNIDHAGTFVSLGKEQFSMVYVKRVGEVGITAQVQPRTVGKTSRRVERSFPFETFTPAQFKFLLEREYDVFGWIDKGLALTLQQAEDLVWKYVSKEVSVSATNEDAFKGPDKMDYSLDEFALYQNPVIAEAQTGFTAVFGKDGKIISQHIPSPLEAAWDRLKSKLEKEQEGSIGLMLMNTALGTQVTEADVLICERKEEDGLTIVERAAPHVKSLNESLQKLDNMIDKEKRKNHE